MKYYMTYLLYIFIEVILTPFNIIPYFTLFVYSLEEKNGIAL